MEDVSNADYADRVTIAIEIIGRRYAKKIGFDMAQSHGLMRIIMAVMSDKKLYADSIALGLAKEKAELIDLLHSEFHVPWIKD